MMIISIDILETCQAYPSGTYEIQALACGATSVKDAIAQATKFGQSMANSRKRTMRAVFTSLCTHCKPTPDGFGRVPGNFGVEPGFKRKKCTSCAGVYKRPMDLESVVFNPEAQS